MKRTVLFFGSFDPIHTGHAMVANYVSQCEGVDELWLVPSRINPLKQDRPPVSDEHRLAMCRLVADRCCNVAVSDVEMSLPLPSYTYRTLCHLRETHPDREFLLMIGTDNWLCFDRWRDHDRIIAEFGMLIYPRPGYAIDAVTLPPTVRLLEVAPQALISSTFVREAISAGKNVNYFLPDAVVDYVVANNLYGSDKQATQDKQDKSDNQDKYYKKDG